MAGEALSDTQFSPPTKHLVPHSRFRTTFTISSVPPTMGGREITTDEFWAQAEANGYTRGAHAEVDQVLRGQKYVSKTKKDYDRTLQCYVL